LYLINNLLQFAATRPHLFGDIGRELPQASCFYITQRPSPKGHLDGTFFMEYIRSMKTKTSVTLSEDLLDAIDQRAGQFKNRSDFIETAVRAFLAQMIRDEQNARDLAIINRRADYLNQEAIDVLAYQVCL